jgi:hypothetical protein
MPLNFLWNSDPVPKGRLKVKAVQISGKIRFFRVYFVEKIKTSGSERNQVAG